VEYLTNVKTVADAYYIICGTKPNEGAVLTHDRYENGDTMTLSFADWFLVQTNYDHWLPPPENDDRRDPAER
jgi:hypothetical protein